MNPNEAPNKTVSAVKEVTWRVPNYSKFYFVGHENGVPINSNTFIVCNAGVKTKWFLRLYPNGFKEENKSHISLFLYCESVEEADCIDFIVKFKFGVVKKNHEDNFFGVECKRSKEQIKGGFGSYKFLSHAKLFDEDNGYVVDESLTILVQLNVQVKTVKPQTRVALRSALNARMKDDYKKMFQNDALADFQLNVSDDEVLKAHKLVLAARSPVFFAMLTNDMKESKDGSVDVPDIDSTVMKEALRFIYYNEVEGLEDIAPKLIFAAEKYQLDELKEICLDEMITAIEPQNVIDFLMIAHKVSGADELFNKCLDIILYNYREVRQCPSWKELPKELVTKILDESCERNYSSAI